jgi:hypothetical protein
MQGAFFRCAVVPCSVALLLFLQHAVPVSNQQNRAASPGKSSKKRTESNAGESIKLKFHTIDFFLLPLIAPFPIGKRSNKATRGSVSIV